MKLQTTLSLAGIFLFSLSASATCNNSKGNLRKMVDVYDNTNNTTVESVPFMSWKDAHQSNVSLTESLASDLMDRLRDIQTIVIDDLGTCSSKNNSKLSNDNLQLLPVMDAIGRDGDAEDSVKAGYTPAFSAIIKKADLILDISKVLNENKCPNNVPPPQLLPGADLSPAISSCEPIQQQTCDILFTAFSLSCSAAVPVPGTAPLCATALVALVGKDCLPCIDEFNFVPICTVFKVLNAIDCNLYLGSGDGMDKIGKRCGLPSYTNDKVEGATCKCNGECQSNACGRFKAGTDSLQCCKKGVATRMYAGYYYCYGMADGTPCWSDEMCTSGYCKGNLGGLQKGICTAKLPNGVWGNPNISKCGSNSDCQNGSCARLQAGTDALNCCPDNSMGLYAGYYYCRNMPAGNVCWSDAMCRSNNCKGNMSGLKKGNCA